MADFYVSSVAYAAVAQWAASHTYAVGDIVRQLAAPAYPGDRCFRASAITTGISGGSEPTWSTGNNATTTDGGVTWTECTAQSNHQHDNGVTNTWTAPAKFFECLDSNGKNVVAAGDRIFASSDHAEAIAITGHTVLTAGTIASPVLCVSVDRTTNNIPPTSAQITAGASISCSVSGGSLILGNNSSRWVGFTFSSGAAGSSSATISLANSQAGTWHFKDCTFTIVGTGANGGVQSVNAASQGQMVTLENPTFNFGATTQGIRILGYGNFRIKKGLTLTGSTPATLFLDGGSGNTKGSIYLNGVDLSGISSTLFASGIGFMEGPTQLANCKLNGSVTIISTAADANAVTPAQGILELINCDSANTNYRNAWYRFAGTVTTETTITRTGGATDGAQKASRKMVSGASHVGVVGPLEHHIYQRNSITGSSLTATVEIISSASLNNNEVWGELEYLSDSGSCLSSFIDDTIADVLTASAAQTSSSAAWDSSPTTPVKQKLAITFTAQKAGLLHFVVKLAKASTTIYVDHLITVA